MRDRSNNILGGASCKTRRRKCLRLFVMRIQGTIFIGPQLAFDFSRVGLIHSNIPLGQVMSQSSRIVVLSALLVGVASVASADALVNQIVPVAQYRIQEDSRLSTPFGLAYDSVNNIIWVNSLNSTGRLMGITPYNSFTAGQIAGFPTVGGVKTVNIPFFEGITPLGAVGGNGNFEALGFHTTTGGIAVNNSATARVMTIAPFSGAVISASIGPGTAAFFDGLDVEGNDIYASPEDGSGRTYKNGAIFLSSAAQRDVSPPLAAGGTIGRWAGVEAITALGLIFTVAGDINVFPFRSVASYDLLGTLIAIDPDGDANFGPRLEDFAFDGRFLYGTDHSNQRVLVFDITGPGGLQVPEPASMALWGCVGLAGLAVTAARRRRARNAARTSAAV